MAGNVLPADQDASLFAWSGNAFSSQSLQYNLSLSQMISCLFGALTNIFALCFLLAHKSLRKSPSTLIVMSMLFADACLTANGLVTNLGMLIGHSWWYEKLGCGTNAFLNLFGSAFSILTLVSMTLERYFAIVKRKPWNNIQCYKAIAVVTGYALLTAIVPFIAEAISPADLGYICRQPGGTYCAVAWWSRQPINIAYTTICAVEIVICTNIMTFAYFKIYTKVREVAEEQRSVRVSRMPSIAGASGTQKAQTGQSTHESKSLQYMERMILIKSVVIVVTFFVLWAPFDFSVLYMAIGGKAIPGVLDGIMVFMIQSQYAFNPLIVIFMDTRCTKIIWKYWQQARGVELDETVDQGMSRTETSSKHSVVNAPTGGVKPTLLIGILRPEKV